MFHLLAVPLLVLEFLLQRLLAAFSIVPLAAQFLCDLFHLLLN